MSKMLVIVHGWSDDGKSFRRLARQLSEALGVDAVTVKIADWVSLQDDVTYSDLAVAMQKAWQALGLPQTPRSVDVVSHSTGALVVRDWMTRFYQPETVPIFRFLMLAPANFGSPLAHKGRSFIGRVLKGWNTFLGQTGAQVLKGLELGSPYTRQLAMRDLFDAERCWYGPGKVLATVLVGNAGYDGVEAIANETGGDGTVRISTANLNAAHLTLCLDARQQLLPGWSLTRSNGIIGFAIADKENHSTLALKDNGPKNPVTLLLLEGALTVTDADFVEWQQRLDSIDPDVAMRSARYQNIVTHVRDDNGQDVADYFVEFYRQTSADRAFEKVLYEQVITAVHAYQDNPAYRSLYLAVDELERLMVQYRAECLHLSLSAQPVFNPPRQPVGYVSVGARSEDGLAVLAADLPQYFVAHQTLIVDIQLQRQIHASVFR